MNIARYERPAQPAVRWRGWLAAVLLLGSAQLLAAEPVIVVQSELQPRRVEFDATIEAVDSGTVSAQTSGRIVALNYDVNDFVAAGAVLLEITNKEQSANVDAAIAELSRSQAHNVEAQLTLRRLQSLFSTGAVAQGQLDQARASAASSSSAVKAAEANLVRAKEAVGYTRVKAPYAGVVTARHVALGETVSPGQALYSGFAMSQMRAVIDIPQRYLQWVEADTEFKVVLVDGSELRSSDAVLFRFADQGSHAFKVRINLSNLDATLSPGMLVKVSFAAGARQLIQVPSSALLHPNTLTAVYRQVDSQWVLTQVRTGAVDGDRIEILAGLNPGDRIARSAYAVLTGK